MSARAFRSHGGAVLGLVAMVTCTCAARAQGAAPATEAAPAAPPCYVGPCEPAPSPAASTATDAAPPPEVKPHPKVPTYPATRIYGGIGYRRLYDVPFVGGEVSAGVGIRKEKLVVLGRVSFASSKSVGGLVLRDLGLGVEMDYRALGLLHIGGGGGFVFGALRRATNSHTLYDAGFGGYAFAALDVLPFGEHAIFVQATLAGELFMGHNSAPIMWGPSAAAGIRY
ncbi:MAG: hypothetical protein JWM74_214 [Myxococcaceae bacterium]|nr:hypothetical protein [Myxococcaceae bacterium]